MEIPYTVRPRPDTGLANPKLGVWLFLASEVMLFGGLFAGYIFMRLGAEPWMWPTGWLNVPVGTFNTFILIFSSVTVILAWEALKMRKYAAYKMWLLATWVCGLAFLGVKLAYEWPTKFHHFGAYVKPGAVAKYETYLGNKDVLEADGKPKQDADGHPMIGRTSKPGFAERRFISGHAFDPLIWDGKDKKNASYKESADHGLKSANVPFVSMAQLDSVINLGVAETDPKKKEKLFKTRAKAMDMLAIHPTDQEVLISGNVDQAKKEAILKRMNTIHLYELDAANAKPYDPANDHARFWPPAGEHAHVSLDKADLLPGHGAWVPKLNTYLACYFMITGLHGLHVLGGCIVFIYFWLNIKGGSKLYHTNPQQLSNRIEVAGLFWHLVDLIWIFVFPIFYLL
jgi:heme/copper-type cytochrome/quinol oxidase subunit 3